MTINAIFGCNSSDKYNNTVIMKYEKSTYDLSLFIMFCLQCLNRCSRCALQCIAIIIDNFSPTFILIIMIVKKKDESSAH